MFFLSYLLAIFIVKNLCLADQLCIDSCTFEHDFDADFVLPANCTFIQREQCDAVLIFDYATRRIEVELGGLSRRGKTRKNNPFVTDNIVHTKITLDGDSSTQHTVEYYCSTGDRCELDYVRNEALPSYIHKSCHLFRAKLISLLHSDPSSQSRACLIQDGEEVICNTPCELFYAGPNLTRHSCDNTRDLAFETTVGRSTPMNKPEYAYRLYAYACTNQACNGYATQDRIDQLIRTDDIECLIDLYNTSDTTITPIGTTTPGTPGRAISFSLSLVLLIASFFILFESRK